FAYDVSGISSVTLYVREDNDGTNPLASTQNETYAGGAEVGNWTALPMNQRAFPAGNVYNNPEINFSVMPTYIADQYWYELTGYDDVLLDYYVEAIDTQGNVKKSPIQHVYVGTGGTSGGAAVSWDPQNPAVGDTLTITYDLNLGVLNNATNPVYIHIGHSGWTQVITPDPAMTYDGVNDVWTYDYVIPGTATTVDFVFNDGAGNWDNNGGADWHVSVTGGGGGSPPFVIDGTLDAGAPLVSSCGTDLYASYDGTYLYMAAPVAAGQDRFFFVNDAYPTGLQLAPWNKAGQTAPHDLLLGNEESNNWAGWFDALGSGTTTGVDQASGAYLEALVEVGPALGGSPGSVWIAHALYDSPDAGALMSQVPCGNANGDLENTEWIEVSAPVSSTPFGDLGRHISVSILSGNPSPRLVRARVFSEEQAIRRAEVFDVRGQLVETLYRGTPQADLTLGWDARSHAAGVYFLRIQGDKEVVTQRVVLLP
ncbi:MAG: T9SS type A sorting domain-containing protein, partial [Candidatus Eisenbacteria bacterium]|nr:T9SS type A sorting domain-containing protein [Candidatus Eisenbacteria bacterium]